MNNDGREMLEVLKVINIRKPRKHTTRSNTSSKTNDNVETSVNSHNKNCVKLKKFNFKNSLELTLKKQGNNSIFTNSLGKSINKAVNLQTSQNHENTEFEIIKRTSYSKSKESKLLINKSPEKSSDNTKKMIKSLSPVSKHIVKFNPKSIVLETPKDLEFSDFVENKVESNPKKNVEDSNNGTSLTILSILKKIDKQASLNEKHIDKMNFVNISNGLNLKLENIFQHKRGVSDNLNMVASNMPTKYNRDSLALDDIEQDKDECHNFYDSHNLVTVPPNLKRPKKKSILKCLACIY